MKIWNGSNQLQSLQSLHNRAAGQILLSGGLQQQDRIAAVVRITLLSYTNSPDNPFLKTVFNYSLLKMCPAKGKIICHYQQIRKKPGYFLPPFPPPDPLLYCPSNEDHLLSPQATPVSIRKFFCSSFPSLQVCSSTEFITWWPNGARGSPWSWQASHDGVYDGGGQLGFSVWVKEQSRAVSVPAARAAQSQQAGLLSKILWRLLLAKVRQCFRMQNLGSGSNCPLLSKGTGCIPQTRRAAHPTSDNPRKVLSFKKLVFLYTYIILPLNAKAD